MKSEHRHELQTNELGKLAEKASAGFDQYYNQILYGMCALLLVTAGWVYWTRTSAATEASAWADVNSCQTPEEFADVAKRHPNTAAATWAKLHEADGYLQSGGQAAFSNREASVTDLKKAEKIFEELAASRSAPADVRERAQFGLARALESQAGDVGPAIAAYETLLKNFPNTFYKSEVEERIKSLGSSTSQSFYAWFEKQNPKPDAPASPHDTGPAEGSGEPSLPNIENIFDVEKVLKGKDMDKIPDPSAKPEESPEKPAPTDAPTEPGTEKPKADTPAPEKTDSEKPATEKSESEKPAPEKTENPEAGKPEAAEKPAATEKPATEKPATGEQPDKNEP